MESINAQKTQATIDKVGLRLSKRARHLLLRLASAVLLVGLWWVLSIVIERMAPGILPGPIPTAQALLKDFTTGLVWGHLADTMIRVLVSFALAMIIGTALGTLMGLSSLFEELLDTWVMVGLTVPGLCYIIVTFMWFGLNEFSAIVAITLASFPSVAINIWSGVKNIDSRLVDMSRIFNATGWTRVSKVVIPQVLPYILASARFGLGIIWKVTVMVELLGRTSGVGYELHYWFQMFNMAQVLAWTLLFVLIMLFLELVVLKQIEYRLFAWRPAVRF